MVPSPTADPRVRAPQAGLLADNTPGTKLNPDEIHAATEAIDPDADWLRAKYMLQDGSEKSSAGKDGDKDAGAGAAPTPPRATRCLLA